MDTGNNDFLQHLTENFERLSNSGMDYRFTEASVYADSIFLGAKYLDDHIEAWTNLWEKNGANRHAVKTILNRILNNFDDLNREMNNIYSGFYRV